MRKVSRAASVAILGLLGPLSGCDDKAGDSGSGANLTISGLVCEQNGDNAICDVVVENAGEGSAGGFDVGLYKENPADGGSLETSTRIDGLGAGDLESVTLNLDDCSGCTIWALADVDDEVFESFEDDNSAHTTAVRRR